MKLKWTSKLTPPPRRLRLVPQILDTATWNRHRSITTAPKPCDNQSMFDTLSGILLLETVYMSCITGHDTVHLIYARRQCIFRESAGSFECHSIQCVKHCLPWRSFTFGGDAISPNIGGRGGRFIVEVHVKSQVQNHANKRIHPRESSTAVRDDFRESTPRSHARQTKHDSRTSNAIWTAGNIYSSGSQAPTFPNKCKDFIHRLGSHVARHWFPNSDWWAIRNAFGIYSHCNC